MLHKLRSILPFILTIGCLIVWTKLKPCEFHRLSIEQEITDLVAFIFAGMGFLSIWGAMSPKIERPDTSLRQARLNCITAGISLLSGAGFLKVLTYSSPNGPIPTHVGIIAVSLLVLVYAIAVNYVRLQSLHERRQHMDENVLWASRISSPALVIWAGFAQAGLDVSFTPLSIITALLASSYLTTALLGIIKARQVRGIDRRA